MRTFVVLALCVAAVLAGESDVEVEVGVEHPTLPGLGSACYPKPLNHRNWRKPKFSKTQFLGVCTADAACAGEQREEGYCAGMNVVCCKHNAVEPAAPSTAVMADEINGQSVVPAPFGGPASTILRATASKCATQGGVCKDKATCTTGPKGGLCPGAANIQCCFPNGAPTTPVTPPPAAGTAMTTLVRIPAGINAGLSMAGASFQTSKLGSPGCPMTKACFSCGCAVKNSKISNNVITLAVTPSVRITGLKPFVEAVKRAFDAMKAASATRPELLTAYNSVKSAGGLCCRPIKKSNGQPGSGYSNHSWGSAVDFYFGNQIDPRGDGKTQYGLLLMAPFFQQQKLYWAAGYGGSSEDAMHFESSQQSLNSWIAGGLIR